MKFLDFKYLIYSLAGIIFVAVLTIAGWMNTPSIAVSTNKASESTNTYTPVPTVTTYFKPSLTPTYTSTPTLVNPFSPTPSFTSTSTPTRTTTERKIEAGELFIIGPLTQTQQIDLYNSSQKFIAPTTIKSIQTGEGINGIGYGSPTIICGPLSIAILQSAQLVSSDSLVPFDFWLLNPYISKDRALINRAFPPDQYENYEVTTPLNQFDFSRFTLLPGDFLYIKHGSGGNFDHMLVVNRIDSEGRAYSVTNYNAEQGFIISEVLLYDQTDPNAGIFRKWTEKRDAASGSTGFGGFELWRLREP